MSSIIFKPSLAVLHVLFLVNFHMKQANDGNSWNLEATLGEFDGAFTSRPTVIFCLYVFARERTIKKLTACYLDPHLIFRCLIFVRSLVRNPQIVWCVEFPKQCPTCSASVSFIKERQDFIQTISLLDARHFSIMKVLGPCPRVDMAARSCKGLVRFLRDTELANLPWVVTSISSPSSHPYSSSPLFAFCFIKLSYLFLFPCAQSPQKTRLNSSPFFYSYLLLHIWMEVHVCHAEI